MQIKNEPEDTPLNYKIIATTPEGEEITFAEQDYLASELARLVELARATCLEVNITGDRDILDIELHGGMCHPLMIKPRCVYEAEPPFEYRDGKHLASVCTTHLLIG